MSTEMLITSHSLETRSVVLKDGIVAAVGVEQTSHKSKRHNIYKGKVVRILPALQGAFIDIGLEKMGFLHVRDLTLGRKQAAIETRLHCGQILMVQIIKDEVRDKGPKLSTRITLSTRYAAFIPASSAIKVSKSIQSADERHRLQRALKNMQASIKLNVGLIARTAAQDVDEQVLMNSARVFEACWDAIQTRYQALNSVGLVYEQWPLAMQMLRDWHGDIDAIRVDCPALFAQLHDVMHQQMPDFCDRLQHDENVLNIFAQEGINATLNELLVADVSLPSGGSVVIESTEAMTTIDVNTASFVGEGHFADTVLKTNLEAVQCIARQLRLRNMGGIIVIDLIDMPHDRDRKSVLTAFDAALADDEAQVDVVGFSTRLGLLTLKRQRLGDSLDHVLMQDCAHCHGVGRVMSATTLIAHIMRELAQQDRRVQAPSYRVVVSAKIFAEGASLFSNVTESLSKPVLFEADSTFDHAQYRVIVAS